MKVTLATGIFYPDIGGPAIHVDKIAHRLHIDGHSVELIAYGDDPNGRVFPFSVTRSSRQKNKLFQWLFYLIYTLKSAAKSQIIYTFDVSAAGLPATLASYIFRIPLIVRVGGDPIWERTVENGKRFITIEEYYQKNLHKKDNILLFYIIKLVLQRATAVIVYNEFFRNFYINNYKIPAKKIHIVKNPISRINTRNNPPTSPEPIILFAGRFVAYKNLLKVIRVFARIRKETNLGKLIFVGKGPLQKEIQALVDLLKIQEHFEIKPSVTQPELFKLIQSAHLSIAPAINEFNPNFILESLSLGTPVLISKGNGLSVNLPHQMLINPFDENDLFKKMSIIANANNYSALQKLVATIEMSQTWQNVEDFHSMIIKNLGNI